MYEYAPAPPLCLTKFRVILTKANQDSSEGQESNERPWNGSKNDVDIQIIHLELLFNLTRMLAKLERGPSVSWMTLASGEKTKSSSTISRSQVKNSKSHDTSWVQDLIKRYNKLPLTRALLLMHTTQIQDTSKETAQQNLQVRLTEQKKKRGEISQCPHPLHTSPHHLPPSPPSTQGRGILRVNEHSKTFEDISYLMTVSMLVFVFKDLKYVVI